VLQLVVRLELSFHVGNIRLQTPELIDLHQLAGHHALARRLPVGDLDLVALHLMTRAATHVVEAAAYRRLDRRSSSTTVRRAVRVTTRAVMDRWWRCIESAGGTRRTLEQRRVDDCLGPTVFDVRDTARQRLFAQARGPVIRGAHPLVCDFGSADLEQVNGTGR
jgi:hypothetical protein